jgi:hypothetical protein
MTSYSIETLSSSTTLGYEVGLFLVDASSGNITLTLPVTTGNAGNIVQVKRSDFVSANTLTIVTDATDGSFIDGTIKSLSLQPGTDAFLFVDMSNTWQRTLSDLSTSFAFGDGSDGVVSITSNTMLIRDMFYQQLDVSNGAIINTNGFRLFVADRLTLTGNGTSIQNSGTNAVGATKGTGAGGAVPGNPISTVGGGFDGVAGVNGLSLGGLLGLPLVSNPLSVGGAGGKGGNANSFLGGIAGLNTPPDISAGGVNCIKQLQNAITARTYASQMLIGGSSGGSGATNSLTATSGGGGGSGGIVVICARSIKCDASQTCRFAASGGNGGNASGSGSAGGGGGAGGGTIIILTRVSKVLNNCPGLTTSVAGGTGGLGQGAGGTNGSNGAAGRIQVVDNL